MCIEPQKYKVFLKVARNYIFLTAFSQKFTMKWKKIGVFLVFHRTSSYFCTR